MGIGCDAYMHVPDQFRNKLAPKSKKLIFVGYEKNSNNYRLYDPETRKIKVSRNVIFNKTSEICNPRRNTIQVEVTNGAVENNVPDEMQNQNRETDILQQCNSDVPY